MGSYETVKLLTVFGDIKNLMCKNSLELNHLHKLGVFLTLNNYIFELHGIPSLVNPNLRNSGSDLEVLKGFSNSSVFSGNILTPGNYDTIPDYLGLKVSGSPVIVPRVEEIIAQASNALRRKGGTGSDIQVFAIPDSKLTYNALCEKQVPSLYYKDNTSFKNYTSLSLTPRF